MTYGWAIIVVFGAIIILAGLGFFGDIFEDVEIRDLAQKQCENKNMTLISFNLDNFGVLHYHCQKSMINNYSFLINNSNFLK